MKKILTTFYMFFIVSTYTHAQVAVGKESITNSSVSLEFGTTESRGFILPYVENTTNITEEGSIIYDNSDPKVKYLKNGGNWTNLSEDDGTSYTIGLLTYQFRGQTKQNTAMLKPV